jgi:hypothetical protein
VGREAFINNTGFATSRWIEDGGFVRIQNITLGYSLPNKLLQKTGAEGIKSVRVYAQVQNPFIFTNYSGLDPELSANTGNTNFGVDAATNPIIRTVTFGVSVGL